MKMRINFFLVRLYFMLHGKLLEGGMANFGVEIVLGMPKHNEQTGRADSNFTWGGPSKYEN